MALGALQISRGSFLGLSVGLLEILVPLLRTSKAKGRSAGCPTGDPKKMPTMLGLVPCLLYFFFGGGGGGEE